MNAKRIKFVSGILLIALVLIFTVQNAETTTIRFLFWTVMISRALVIFAMLGIGILLGVLWCSYGRRGSSGPR